MAYYNRTNSVPMERLSADRSDVAQKDVVKLLLAIDQQTVVVQRALMRGYCKSRIMTKLVNTGLLYPAVRGTPKRGAVKTRALSTATNRHSTEQGCHKTRSRTMPRSRLCASRRALRHGSR